MPPVRANAMDHVVLVLFENRSFDNLLGRLYTPGEVESFEGVIGKDLANPVPDWAEHGADGDVVPYGISVGMDVPDPDPGEEYPHTNTQLFNILDEVNRCKDATEMVAPYNAPPAGRLPTMDGFVTDYISFLTVELCRPPTYEEYSQIMTGYTPEQVPVISTLARGFGVFDHWFSEVPSQTLPNRSFWTAATSSGFVVNRPVTNFMRHHAAETIFDRLERCGRTWKVYVLEPGPLSFTGFIHMPRLRDRFATHFFPFAEFERDAAAGTLPDFSLIEPNLLAGHGDYHPAFGRALIPGVDVLMDAPSSILAGEDFLGRIYRAVRSAPRRRGQTPSTPCSWSASTSLGVRTTTFRRVRATSGPRLSARSIRVRLRPLRLPRASGHRVAMGPPGDGLHRRVPPHFSARDPARGVEPWRAFHRQGRGRTRLREGVQSRGAAATRDLARHRPAAGPPVPGGAGEGNAGSGYIGSAPLPRSLRARPPRRRPP